MSVPDKAVEAAGLAQRQAMRRGVPDGAYMRAPLPSEVRAGLEAARPHIEAAALRDAERAWLAEHTEPGALYVGEWLYRRAKAKSEPS